MPWLLAPPNRAIPQLRLWLGRGSQPRRIAPDSEPIAQRPATSSPSDGKDASCAHLEQVDVSDREVSAWWSLSHQPRHLYPHWPLKKLCGQSNGKKVA